MKKKIGYYADMVALGAAFALVLAGFMLAAFGATLTFLQ